MGTLHGVWSVVLLYLRTYRTYTQSKFNAVNRQQAYVYLRTFDLYEYDTTNICVQMNIGMSYQQSLLIVTSTTLTSAPVGGIRMTR